MWHAGVLAVKNALICIIIVYRLVEKDKKCVLNARLRHFRTCKAIR